MKNAGLKLGLLLCIVTFSASAAGYISGVRTSRKGAALPIKNAPVTEARAQNEEPISDVSKNDTLTEMYVLKEYEGKIALFTKYSGGTEALHDVYDVSVSLLPSSDREILKEGISCKSLSEALLLVEDFSS